MANIRKLFVLLAVCIFTLFAFVAGSDAAIIKALSTSYSAVSDAVSVASSGDTVIVPAGVVTWSSALKITKGITLQGAGIDSTAITSGVSGSSKAPIMYVPSAPAKDETFIMIGFTINGSSRKSACLIINNTSDTPINNVFVHHCKFLDGIINFKVVGPVYGVASNNSFYGTGDHTEVLGHDQRSWDFQTAEFGTEKAFFFEDNDFYGNGMMFQNSNGAQFTFRYNTVHDRDYIQIFDMHGNNHNPVMPGYTKARACLNAEVYENTIALTRGGSVKVFLLRGGSLLMYNNTFTHTVQSSYISLVDYDLTSDKLIPAIVLHNGIRYICLQDHTSSSGNEPGTGGGAAYWNTTSIVPNVYIKWKEGLDFLESEVYDPIIDTYFYNNLENGDELAYWVPDDYKKYIVENKNYFLINPIGQTIKGKVYQPYTYPHPLRKPSPPNPRKK